MLRTRLWMGSVLIALVVGMLLVDQHLGPWYPFLFAFVLGLALAACFELLHLLPANQCPHGWLCYTSVAALVVVNWLPHFADLPTALVRDPWQWLWFTFAGVALLVFLVEMATFREPGESVVRMALTLFLAAYLGVLPSFLVQLRWLGDGGAVATVALALAVFVPKCCDIGAYFTGRLIGRHPMTPVLSPKKTVEGGVGGLAAAVLATIALDRLGPASPLHKNLLAEVGFGLTVGVAGMLGDLAESLIKRDCRQKDASHAVPGFGGVLDVVDAVIFAAPLAYWWLHTQ
jgi:phosphatidate cytidylyltransferase